MGLVQLTLENYKPFRELERIPIRPLTILIGKNNSGKSAISRLPLLIARGATVASESPLELEFDNLEFGASFRDLIHNRSPHGAFRIGATISSEGKLASFEARLQHFDEFKLLQIAEFTIGDGNGSTQTFHWAGTNPLTDASIFEPDGVRELFSVNFSGFLPVRLQAGRSNAATEKFTNEMRARFDETRRVFSGYLSQITYLGPFREITERTHRYASGSPKTVGISGAKVAEILGHDHLRWEGRLVAQVGEWIATHLGGWKLVVEARGDDNFELLLESPRERSLRVNLRDVGTGIGQVIALVVQRYLDLLYQKKEFIEIVEQPELHLHPSAHGDLSDLYVSAVNQSAGVFLIETHSENFILRIRRRIAEKTLDPDKVAILYVNDDQGSSPIRPIKIDAEGEVDYWPEGVFSEDFAEVRSIRQAQQKK